MNREVDIKELAIVRDEKRPVVLRRRHIVSRYLIPGALLIGFTALVAWAARDKLAPPHEVSVIPVMASQSASLQEGTPLFQAAGWIEPRPTPIRVAALAPGVVERLLVVQDQAVKRGELLAELVRADAELARERALASLKLREAELQEAQAALAAATTRLDRPVHLHAQIAESEAALAEIATEQRNLPFELRRAEAQLRFAEKDFRSKQTAEAVVAGRSVLEAQSKLEAARATVEELQQRAKSLAEQQQALMQRRDALRVQLELLADEKQAKHQAEAQVAAGEAKIAQAKVALAEAQLRLERMTVRAPVDGRVYQLIAFPGTTLTGGMGPVPNADGSTVVTLYQPEMLQVRVDARFQDIPKVSLGQHVLINNPAVATPLSGKVLFVSSEANIQKNTLQVKVAIDAPPAVLKPEMLVDVTFLASEAADDGREVAEELRLYLPEQVVRRKNGSAYVWIADQSDNRARKVEVELGGPASGGLVEVSGTGLTAASRVIVRGADDLEDGKRIRIDAEEPPTSAHVSPRMAETTMHASSPEDK